VNQASEVQLERELIEHPGDERLLNRLAIRRATIALVLSAALGLFLWWLPEVSRRLLLASLFTNRLLIALLLIFGLIAISLIWSKGQRLDVWLFQALNLHGYHAAWMDRLMWVATQIGTFGFSALVVVVSYVLGYHPFAFALTLGSLTLWLLVTIIKTFADRARPFKLLLETRVIGWRARGRSFPSGHTTQTFFTATLLVSYFQSPLVIAAALYGVAVLVAFTRVYLGMLYPRDVMAGAILALIGGIVGGLVAPSL
jgi:membrane-associated phospholipid phosphatase